MTIDRSRALIVIFVALFAILAACSSDKESADAGAQADDTEAARDFTDDRAQDKAEIQALFDELVARVHERDFGVLYDNEFTYLKDEYTYDDYLGFGQLKSYQIDTVKSINIVDFTFRGDDTCDVMMEAVFRNAPPGQDRARNAAVVYYHHGRWIKPTISGTGNGPELQRTYERTIFQAESAAAAEAAEGL